MKIFSFLKVRVQLWNDNGIPDTEGYTLKFGEDIVSELNVFLKPFKLEPEKLEIATINYAVQVQEVPYCIVLFPEQMQIANHLFDVRSPNVDNCRFTSYDLLNGKKLAEGELPDVSVIFIRDFRTLKLLSTRSSVFGFFEDMNTYCQENGHYLVFCDLVEAKVINAIATSYSKERIK